MMYESVVGFFTSNINLYIVLLVLSVLAITEYLVIYFAKRNKDRGSIISDTIGIKLGSLICALIITTGAIMVISGLLVAIDSLIENCKEVLMVLGVVAIIVGFFAANVPIVKKYSKKVVHKKRFKKGDRLIATDGIACVEDNKSVCKEYDYEFVKNLDYDLIEVKSLTRDSTWKGETRTFEEEYFAKARKKK